MKRWRGGGGEFELGHKQTPNDVAVPSHQPFGRQHKRKHIRPGFYSTFSLSALESKNINRHRHENKSSSHEKFDTYKLMQGIRHTILDLLATVRI